MNHHRQTPHKDFVRVTPVERFAHRDRWSGKAEPRLPKVRMMLATLFAFTTGVGVLALAD